jgi:hypothetical protein
MSGVEGGFAAKDVTTVEIIEERFATFEAAQLIRGHGEAPNGAVQGCIMDWASFVTGEEWSDQPSCVSPVLRSFLIRLNDRLGDEDRQALKPYLPKVIGTAGDGQDAARRALAAKYVVNTGLPDWLEMAGMLDRAAQLREMEVTEWTPALYDLLREIRGEAWKVRDKHRASLKAKVLAELKRKGVKGTADAVADAVAAAAADADADAAAAAVADAVADAVAAAAADADAVAVAAAAAGDPWGKTYDAVYAKVKPVYEKRYEALNAGRLPMALALLDDMVDPSKAQALAGSPSSATGDTDGEA